MSKCARSDRACIQTWQFPGEKGDKIVGMRVVPLVIEEEKMNHVKELCGEEPIFTILPFHQMKVGIVTTGSEVYHGRITDKFTPVVKAKIRRGRHGSTWKCTL